LFKILISITSLALSIYMLYSSYILSQTKTDKLYIPPNNPSDTMPQVFPHKTHTNITNLPLSMFSNINLDYIIGYN
jgi:hypothetical protein